MKRQPAPPTHTHVLTCMPCKHTGTDTHMRTDTLTCKHAHISLHMWTYMHMHGHIHACLLQAVRASRCLHRAERKH